MSWGTETPRLFTEAEIKSALASLDSGRYGQILRAKGYVAADKGWLHFDYVPGESDVRRGPAGVTGRLCVIGSKLDEQSLKELFKVG
jgi:G3E family GTPase